MSSSETILEIAAEGGSLTLIGRQLAPGVWQFACRVVDQTEALLGDPEPTPSGPSPVKSIPWVDGWEAGLQLLDRYNWLMMSPIAIHPDFAQKVATAIEQRLAHPLESLPIKTIKSQWQELLNDFSIKQSDLPVGTLKPLGAKEYYGKFYDSMWDNDPGAVDAFYAAQGKTDEWEASIDLMGFEYSMWKGLKPSQAYIRSSADRQKYIEFLRKNGRDDLIDD